jgi:hypothetical protein
MLCIMLWLACISACTTGPTSGTVTPAPTTAVLTVHLAGELALLRPHLAACTGEIPGSGLLVFEADIPALPAGADEVTLWFGEPPVGAREAALLGFDEVLVVASAGSRLETLSEAEVRALFGSGGPPQSGAALEIWLPQPGLAARGVLDAFLEGSAYPPQAFLAPAASAMAEAVAGNPDAVGVIPAAWLTDELQSLYTLGELPVLALTAGVPKGILRDLIGCMQVNPVYGGGG